jgi:hypothetical protein
MVHRSLLTDSSANLCALCASAPLRLCVILALIFLLSFARCGRFHHRWWRVFI